MKLSVPERLHLMGLLPKEGDFITLKAIRQSREMLSFNEDAEEFGLKQEDGRITWAKDEERDIDLPPRALPVIVEALVALDKEKRLSDEHVTLYEKFVGE